MKSLMSVILSVSFAMVFSSALAAEKVWQGGASGNWAEEANWSGGVPTAAEN